MSVSDSTASDDHIDSVIEFADRAYERTTETVYEALRAGGDSQREAYGTILISLFSLAVKRAVAMTELRIEGSERAHLHLMLDKLWVAVSIESSAAARAARKKKAKKGKRTSRGG